MRTERPEILSDEDMKAIFAATKYLKRCRNGVSGFAVTRDKSRGRLEVFSEAQIRRLVSWGFMKWGNESRSWVRLTDAGWETMDLA